MDAGAGKNIVMLGPAAALSEIAASLPASVRAASTFEKLIGDVGEGVLGFAVRHYAPGTHIVQNGLSEDKSLCDRPEFQYSHVPFGIILKGTVTVYENKVGVRQLKAGDCIGLFETAHWINTGNTRRIGKWTLSSGNGVSVLFVSKDVLRKGAGAKISSFGKSVVKRAQEDHVPHPVTKLPLLDWVAAHTTGELLADTAVIIHSHVLPTNVAFFRHMAHLVDKHKIFVLDKPYSTVPASLNELIRAGIDVTRVTLREGDVYHDSLERGISLLWRKVTEAYANGSFSRLLILDDGGDLWATIPWQNLDKIKIAGVEQTQRGLSRFRTSKMALPPIVSVASSGIKKLVEAEFIGTAIVDKLLAAGRLGPGTRVGVIGMGSIGRRIFQDLKDRGRQVLCYDGAKPAHIAAANFRSSLDALVDDVDLLIGSTGIDILRGVTLENVQGVKTFASASSSDIEFGTLLRQAGHIGRPLEEIDVSPHPGLKCRLLNGGFPVNFDREREWEPSDDIELTRCLLYVGLQQAASLLDAAGAAGFYTLDIEAQEKMLGKWLELKDRENVTVKPDFRDARGISHAVFVEGLQTMPTIWRTPAE